MHTGIVNRVWTACFVRAWAAAAAVSAPAVGDAALPTPEEGVRFDGETAYATAPGVVELNDQALTVAGWVNLADAAGSQVFLNMGEANSGLTFYLFSNKVRMLVGRESDSYVYAAAPPPALNTWTHYAGTYDGKAVKIYANGKLQHTTPAPGRINETKHRLFIGALNERERFLKGRMDDVRVWRRVLDDAEVSTLAVGQADDRLGVGLVARWTHAGINADGWKPEPASAPVATRVRRDLSRSDVLINKKDNGYRGIWYMNQPSGDEYVYKYSGGMGTYPANHIPYSWYVPEVNKTFFCYGGTTHESNTRLMHMVSYYDHAAGRVPRPTILLDKKTDDAHDNPVINVDDRGFIWIFSSSHGRSRPSYISRSKKPYSIDEFELVWTGNFSYPQPWHLPGQGFLFMHTYYDPGRTICMTTSRDGVKWSPRRLLSVIGEGHYQVSCPLGGGRIGTAFMYHPQGKGLNWRTNLYYMESADFGETWTSAAGQTLDIPLTQITNPALVKEYESKGLLVYIHDLNHDDQGRPVILYTTSRGYESGPQNDPRVWRFAHWTGSRWTIHGGDIVADNNYDTGSIYVESPDLWRIIGPSLPGPQAYNPGGEIAMWISTDTGASWRLARQMTRGSAYNHTYVRRPVNAHADFYAFWADGHGRKPSDSRLYFCNQAGDVLRLPVKMNSAFEKPQRVIPSADNGR